jgi:hypothetical protein
MHEQEGDAQARGGMHEQDRGCMSKMGTSKRKHVRPMHTTSPVRVGPGEGGLLLLQHPSSPISFFVVMVFFFHSVSKRERCEYRSIP